MSCKCQCCGNLYKVDILIENKLWEKIKYIDKPRGFNLLCGSCIMKKIEKISGYSVWHLKNKDNIND